MFSLSLVDNDFLRAFTITSWNRLLGWICVRATPTRNFCADWLLQHCSCTVHLVTLVVCQNMIQLHRSMPVKSFTGTVNLSLCLWSDRPTQWRRCRWNKVLQRSFRFLIHFVNFSSVNPRGNILEVLCILFYADVRLKRFQTCFRCVRTRHRRSTAAKIFFANVLCFTCTGSNFLNERCAITTLLLRSLLRFSNISMCSSLFWLTTR